MCGPENLELLIVSLCKTNYPAHMRRGKVIGLSVCRHHEIAISRVLGICVCSNYNKSIDIGEKLVSVRFKWLNMAHWHYKLCIFRSACLWFTDCPHSMCDVTRLRMFDLNVGKGRQVMKCIQQVECFNTSYIIIILCYNYQWPQSAWGIVLWRALVGKIFIA